MRNALLSVIALVSLSFAAGCSDPVVGTWEGTEDSNVDLTIREGGDGYTGDGHIYMCDSDYCYLCSFDFDATDMGDGRFIADGHFTGDCSSLGDFNDIDCEAKNETMFCDVGGNQFEYEKVE